MEEKITEDHLKELRDLHPYREAGKPETYSKYNEGWSDALDLAQSVFEQAQKDAYNQALVDAALLAKVEYVMVQSGNNPEYKYQVDKESILKLKK